MRGSSLQLLLIFVLLSLCLKPTVENHWGVRDAIQGCIEQERQALLEIKEDLIDDYGHLSSWSTEEEKKDCCKWRGVYCSNQTGHVIMLKLNALTFPPKPLRGKLNPFLIELQYLTYLDVSFNDFNHTQIPEFIGSLSNLRYLNLSSATFGRNIPFQLGNLSSLQYLDLGENHFNNPENLEWLPQLSSLRYLAMSFINLSKVNNWLQVVNKLPHLTSLYLHSCDLPNIFSVPLVNSSTSLDVLDLSHNHLTSSSSVLEWLFKSNTSVFKLYLNENQFHGLIPDAFSKMKSLAHLYLGDNEFEGGIPKTFGGVCNLKTLSLSRNNLRGQLLEFIQNLTECANHSIEALYLDWNHIVGSLPDLTIFPLLRELRLSNNRLNGTIPESFGKLSNLESLYLGDNTLRGVISEHHFSKLTKLKKLYLSNTSLVFNLSSDWVPPFQLDKIYLTSCHLGSRFPKWLQTQKKLYWLDISNSGISDTISNFSWVFSPQLEYMDLSYNQITGQIANLSLEFYFPPAIDLGSNKLEGKIPRFMFKAIHLDLSNNMFSGPIQSLCAVSIRNLHCLDLSNNQLSGELPDCWMHLEELKILNLGNNHFHGKIPSTMGSLLGIETLDLSNNSFSGELPSSLKNCTELTCINLGHNNLSGQLPMWLGTSNPNLVVLILRSNHLYGSMPSHLCHLAHLQLLDLALNQISGSIPKCLNNLTLLTQKLSSNATITHLYEEDFSRTSKDRAYDDHVFWMWKGREYEYKGILGLVKSIDLSSNKLTGTIPGEIMELAGLISLNLSKNLLSGQISSNIGALLSLEVMDLSKNQLSGGIPSSLSQILGLSFLDLSNNNLSGQIPTGPQLNTFTATAYEGNPGLCGAPLPKNCSGEETTQNSNKRNAHDGKQDDEDGFITLGFYVSVALGFFAGFWGVFGTLVLNRSLQLAFFKRLNDFKDWLYVVISVNMTRLQRQLQKLIGVAIRF
ncbi:receptor-like protein EIX1 [Quercus suber]|uniref:Receptor-like protein eix2 n=1 Tax=Quercus suber TaxID=58331 RepID=A0AAW0M4J5_QUESU